MTQQSWRDLRAQIAAAAWIECVAISKYAADALANMTDEQRNQFKWQLTGLCLQRQQQTYPYQVVSQAVLDGELLRRQRKAARKIVVAKERTRRAPAPNLKIVEINQNHRQSWEFAESYARASIEGIVLHIRNSEHAKRSAGGVSSGQSRRHIERDRKIHDAKTAGKENKQIADDHEIFGKFPDKNSRKRENRQKLVSRVLGKSRP